MRIKYVKPLFGVNFVVAVVAIAYFIHSAAATSQSWSVCAIYYHFDILMSKLLIESIFADVVHAHTSIQFWKLKWAQLIIIMHFMTNSKNQSNWFHFRFAQVFTNCSHTAWTIDSNRLYGLSMI